MTTLAQKNIVSVHGLRDHRRQLWRLVHGGRTAKPTRGVGPRRDLFSMGRGPQGPRERIQNISAKDFWSLLEPVLAQGQSLEFRVRGHSMRPGLRAGDLLRASPIEEHNLRVGELVLARPAKGPGCVHRIADLSPGRVLLRADTDGRSQWHEREAIMARVLVLQRRSADQNPRLLWAFLVRKIQHAWSLRRAK